MRKLLVAIFGVAALAAVLWWRWPRGGDSPAGGSGTASGSALSGTRTSDGPAAPPRGDDAKSPAGTGQVRRLTKEERRLLGEKIAAAVKRARTAGSNVQGSAAPLPDEDPVIPLERVGKPLQKALQESVAILADCYQQPAGSAAGQDAAPPKNAAAMMTMVSDPDLGTVIDTGEITDADGKPLDRQLDDCLRNAIDSLALPPLGSTGKLQLQYTFRFD